MIDKLCAQLEPLIEASEADPYFDKELAFYATQVKQKHGRLCFYMSLSTDGMLNLIEDMETESARTCEECGEPGKLALVNGWDVTLCTQCKSFENHCE